MWHPLPTGAPILRPRAFAMAGRQGDNEFLNLVRFILLYGMLLA